MKQAMRVLTSSETAEWYTPPYITNAARQLMDGIELDPASCEAANQWIKAKRIYTIEDNGLALDWFGTIWLNPPYGKIGNRSSQDVWARKLEAEFAAGRVKEGCLLTKTVPGYLWWERLFRRWPVCFVKERVKFIRLNTQGEIVDTGRAKAGTSIWYIGRPFRYCSFRYSFNNLGRVIYPPERE